MFYRDGPRDYTLDLNLGHHDFANAYDNIYPDREHRIQDGRSLCDSFRSRVFTKVLVRALLVVQSRHELTVCRLRLRTLVTCHSHPSWLT